MPSNLFQGVAVLLVCAGVAALFCSPAFDGVAGALFVVAAFAWLLAQLQSWRR